MGIECSCAIDGFAFGTYQAMPATRPRGAIVVIQEIFGVNDHIRQVCDGYAAAGYAAIAPQIFDRAERDVEMGYEQNDMTRGIEIARGKLKMEQTLLDLQAAVDDARRFGKVGVVGYCFGGLLAWISASDLTGISASCS
jgi:carboxymethylenebutenolidase